MRVAAVEAEHSWWTLSQLSDPDAVRLAIQAAPSARGHQHSVEEIFAMLRVHVSTGGTAAIVAPGTGTAHRVVEQLRDADVAAVCLDPGDTPTPGVVGVLRGPLHDGIVLPESNLVVITETDLTGSRVAVTEGKRLAAKDATSSTRSRSPGRPRRARPARHRPVRRDGRAHGRRCASRVPGARVRVRPSGAASDRLYVPMDSLDQLSPLRRRRGADADQAGRQRLGQHQDQGPQGGPRDRARARRALRQAAGVARVTRSAPTPRGSASWRTRSPSPRPPTS